MITTLTDDYSKTAVSTHFDLGGGLFWVARGRGYVQNVPETQGNAMGSVTAPGLAFEKSTSTERGA